MLNKKVYIISICLKQRKDQECEFHFRGFYNGQMVDKLLVKGGKFEPTQEYLIKAEILGFEDGTLICRCLKYKSIFNS